MFASALRFLSGKPSIPNDILQREEALAEYRPGGYHPVQIGDKLDGTRYSIVQKLGWGRYSTVWLAKDSESNRHVAIKILNSDAEKYELPELPLLEHVNTSDRQHPGYAYFTAMLHHFKLEGPNGLHTCIVFEVQGESLTDLQRQWPNKMLPVPLVKQICRQALLALDFLHSSCSIIHTDVKPTNMLICLTDPEEEIQRYLESYPPRVHPVKKSSSHVPSTLVESQPISTIDRFEDPHSVINMKLSDIGVGSWVYKHNSVMIQAPALRAPEVIIRAHWDTSADIWSLGCVIYFMITGRPLFNPSPSQDPSMEYTAEEDHFAQMMALFGAFPVDFLEAGKCSEEWFDMETGELLRLFIMPEAVSSLSAMIDAGLREGFTEKDAHELEEFLSLMIRVRPEERATAKELLRHDWLQCLDAKY